MLKSINSFDERKGSFKTWLFKISSNKIIDYYRSAYYKHVTVVNEIDINLECRSNEIEEFFLIKEESNKILDIINSFNTSIQQIIRLKIFGDMTFKDISKSLELPESTIKTKYYASIRKIKKIMEDLNNGY